MQYVDTIVAQRLSAERVDVWFKDLVNIVLLTYWILLYPSSTSLFSYSKENARKEET